MTKSDFLKEFERIKRNLKISKQNSTNISAITDSLILEFSLATQVQIFMTMEKMNQRNLIGMNGFPNISVMTLQIVLLFI